MEPLALCGPAGHVAGVDARLRSLRRRSETTGALEDEAALLRERSRAGDLDRERLELAAWLGHPAAVSVVGRQAPDDLELLLCSFEHLLQHGPGLGRWGKEACVRAALATGRLALGRWRALVGNDESVVQAIRYSEEWLSADSHSGPQAEARRVAREVDERGLELYSLFSAERPGQRREHELAFSALRAIAHAALTVGGPAPEAELVAAEGAGYAAWHGHADAVGAICEELIPWALSSAPESTT